MYIQSVDMFQMMEKCLKCGLCLPMDDLLTHVELCKR